MSVFQKSGIIVCIYAVCFQGWLCAGQDNGQTIACSSSASDNITVVKMCQDYHSSGSTFVVIDSSDAGSSMPPEGIARCMCTLTIDMGDKLDMFIIRRHWTAMEDNCRTKFHIRSSFQSEFVRCSSGSQTFNREHFGPTVKMTLFREPTAPSSGYDYGYCWNVHTKDSRNISVSCTVSSPSIASQNLQTSQNADIAESVVTTSRPRPKPSIPMNSSYLTWPSTWSTTWSTALKTATSTKSTDANTMSSSPAETSEVTTPNFSLESINETTSSQLQDPETIQQTDLIINSTKTPFTDSTVVNTPTSTSTSSTEKSSKLPLTQITEDEKSSPSIELTSATPDFTAYYNASTEYSVTASPGPLSSVSSGNESTELTTSTPSVTFPWSLSVENDSSATPGSASNGSTSVISSWSLYVENASSATPGSVSNGSTSVTSSWSLSVGNMSSSTAGSVSNVSTSVTSSWPLTVENASSATPSSVSNASTSVTSSWSLSVENTQSVTPVSVSNASTSVTSFWSLSVENGSSATPGSASNGTTSVTYSWPLTVENATSATSGSVSNASTSVTSSWSLSVENTSSATPGSVSNASTSVTSSWSLSVENTSSATPSSVSNASTSVTSSWSLSVENTSSATPGSVSNASTSVTSSWSLSVENASSATHGSVSKGSTSVSLPVENASSTHSASAISGSTVTPSSFSVDWLSFSGSPWYSPESTVSASTYSTSIPPTLQVAKMCQNSLAEGLTKVSLDIFNAALTLPLDGAVKCTCTVTVGKRGQRLNMFQITPYYPSSRKKDCGIDVSVTTGFGGNNHYGCLPDPMLSGSLHIGDKVNITLLRDAESPTGGYVYLLGLAIVSSNSKKISIACEEFSIPESKLLRGGGDLTTAAVSSSTTTAKTGAQTGNQNGNAQKASESLPDGAVIGLCVALSVLLIVLVVIAMICLYRNMKSYRAGKSSSNQPETAEKCNFMSVDGDKNTQLGDQSFKAFDNQGLQFSNIEINQSMNNGEKQNCDKSTATANALLDILNEQNT